MGFRPNLRHRSALLAFAVATAVGAYEASADPLLIPGDLVVSRSVYQGTAATVTAGAPLPGGSGTDLNNPRGTATDDGRYPSVNYSNNVWKNETQDPSFGVTAPIFLDTTTTSGVRLHSVQLPTTGSNQIVTSFPSKSELGLNLTPDAKGLTLMGYGSAINQLDISNSNTPAIIEPGNITVTPTYREVAEIDSNGNVSRLTKTNAYAGNNGRAAILGSNGQIYTVGNAGNAQGSPAVTGAAGVQSMVPGSVGGTNSSSPNTTKVGSFSVFQTNPSTGQPYYTSATAPKDKPAKDDNYRGETVYNNTLYVSKGSGSNGINTVYQVGASGTLPTGTGNPINVLPGFPTTLARASTGVMNPFGLFFANATTLYVGDEGDGTLADTFAGLQKWSLINGSWHMDYVLRAGLIGAKIAIDSNYPTSLQPTVSGLRNISGNVGAGTVTLYAITATTSANTDTGADPNSLVAITDNLSSLTLPGSESFTTLETAGYGEVLRGVVFVPEPASISLVGLAAIGLLMRRRRIA